MSKYYGNYNQYLGAQKCCDLRTQGPTGDIGPTGPASIGAMGPTGNDGKTGPTGATGYGCRGPTGPTGASSVQNWTSSGSVQLSNISSGSWTNITTNPILSVSGLNQNTTYKFKVSFGGYCNSYNQSSAIYLSYFNHTIPFYGDVFTQNRPVARTGELNTFSSGVNGTSQFIFNDNVSFTTDNYGTLDVYLNIGHNDISNWSTMLNWTIYINVI